ncbi:MAG: hypothetical protein ACKPKO_04090, partial [Candidatus Fonsibacter sp.]
MKIGCNIHPNGCVTAKRITNLTKYHKHWPLNLQRIKQVLASIMCYLVGQMNLNFSQSKVRCKRCFL